MLAASGKTVVSEWLRQTGEHNESRCITPTPAIEFPKSQSALMTFARCRRSALSCIPGEMICITETRLREIGAVKLLGCCARRGRSSD
jgi:hypothetical protein